MLLQLDKEPWKVQWHLLPGYKDVQSMNYSHEHDPTKFDKYHYNTRYLLELEATNGARFSLAGSFFYMCFKANNKQHILFMQCDYFKIRIIIFLTHSSLGSFLFLFLYKCLNGWLQIHFYRTIPVLMASRK